jgi:hypothetical protein
MPLMCIEVLGEEVKFVVSKTGGNLGKLLPPEVDQYRRVPQRQLESDKVLCVDVG